MMETARTRFVDESEAELAKVKKLFEKETQEREDQVTRDQQEFDEQKEQQLTQMKNFYEMEKQ